MLYDYENFLIKRNKDLENLSKIIIIKNIKRDEIQEVARQ